MTECPQCEALNQALMVAVEVIQELHSAINDSHQPDWSPDAFTANMQRLEARAKLIAATMKGEPCQGSA